MCTAIHSIMSKEKQYQFSYNKTYNHTNYNSHSIQETNKQTDKHKLHSHAWTLKT